MLNNEVQPRGVKTLRVPDYFAEYRDKGDGLAGFLGTSIVAKVRAFSWVYHARCCAHDLRLAAVVQ